VFRESSPNDGYRSSRQASSFGFLALSAGKHDSRREWQRFAQYAPEPPKQVTRAQRTHFPRWLSWYGRLLVTSGHSSLLLVLGTAPAANAAAL